MLWITGTAWAEVKISGHRTKGLQPSRCIHSVKVDFEESSGIRSLNLAQCVFEFTFGTRLVGHHGGIRDKDLRKLGVLPISNVVVLFFHTEDITLNGVALVVDQHDIGLRSSRRLGESSLAVSRKEPSPIKSTWRRSRFASMLPNSAGRVKPIAPQIGELI